MTSRLVPVRAVALAGAAFLAGGVPLGALLLRRLRPGLDIHAVGTGNPGTSNIFRNAGLGAAAVVGPLQFLQGVLPVAAARRIHADHPGAACTAAVAAVTGSCWPVVWPRGGGRGMAVLHGTVAALSPSAFLVLLAADAAGLASGHIARGVGAGVLLLPLTLGRERGRAGCATGLALVAVTAARRLDGVRADLRETPPGPAAAIVARRLFDDVRPGDSLLGPRRTAAADRA